MILKFRMYKIMSVERFGLLYFRSQLLGREVGTGNRQSVQVFRYFVQILFLCNTAAQQSERSDL